MNNRQINRRYVATFPCRRIPINKYRRNEGNRKYPLEYHSNNCCHQYILINAEQAGKSLSRNGVFAHH